ncbi:MAG: hypothetical protein HOM34_06690 [Planctomycetes bacterium]|nr:hypothetical protein [Planctomycetota bacterium]MBT5120391.1 hypothetical protein [Planctomycetota bacterium]MBT7318257.1 hypothetical protein [Planctomycetota bacterium]
MTNDREVGKVSREWESHYGDEDTVRRYEARYARGRKKWNNRLILRATMRALRELHGGELPHAILDFPSGPGRFTAEFRALGIDVIHADVQPAMLAAARRAHGRGTEILANIYEPPFNGQAPTALCLRLMQHLDRASRIAALAGLAQSTDLAVIGYYPGWHFKTHTRRIRHSLGFKKRPLRERLTTQQIQDEAAAAGWQVRAMRRAMPLFSECVLILLERTPTLS